MKVNTFYNPYNFVPALPRDDGTTPEGLRDGPPPGHDRWHPELWSGRIAVRMTTITPLLLVTGTLVEGGHRELTARTVTDHDGTTRVDLAPTQLKGMLRGAFEAVTNSRFGVVSKDHHNPLGYRSDAGSGSGLLPVIVEQVEDRPRVTILGTLHSGTGLPVVLGAVLPGWEKQGENARAATAFLHKLHHRQHVEAWVVAETITTPKGKQLCRWRVTGAVPVGDTLPARQPGGPEPWARVRGYLHLTGPTIKAKRWERLFITELLDHSDGVSLDEPRQLPAPRSAELLSTLAQLVVHQRGIHTGADRNDIWCREHPAGTPRMPWDFFGHEPGSTAWSRHLYEVSTRPARAPADVAPSWTGPDVPPKPPPQAIYTCWAERSDGGRLRPVMISRLLYDRAPFELLHPSLHPAETLDELSPADRVFGWVAPGPVRDEQHRAPRAARSAHRGQLRVVKVSAPPADEAVTEHPDGRKILPALSAPKPSQGRFYLAKGNDGQQPLSTARKGFFEADQTLRGRKVYLYRRGDHNHDRHTPSGVCYDAEATSQNSTVRSWVNAGAEFGFELIVDNLTDQELGALLWLLDPQRLGRDAQPDQRQPDQRQPGRHRLGMGKPYGFGVVELSLVADRTTLARGKEIALRLYTLDPAPANEPAEWAGLAEQFENDVSAGPLAPVLRAMRMAAAGVGKDNKVHYPRSPKDDDGYDWFVEEERRATGVAQGKATGVAQEKAQPLPLLDGSKGPGTLRGHS